MYSPESSRKPFEMPGISSEDTLECSDPEVELVASVKQLAKIGSIYAEISTRLSGRSLAIASTCDQVCEDIEFGAGCMPCPVSFFTVSTEAATRGSSVILSLGIASFMD